MKSMYQPCQYLPPTYSGDHLELLFYCISFTFYAGLSPLDRFLKGILLHDLMSPGGGDPGWSLDLILDRKLADFPDEWDACVKRSAQPEAGCYEAWANSEFSEILPDTAYYTVEEVRHYIRVALSNIAQQKPESAEEALATIARFGL